MEFVYDLLHRFEENPWNIPMVFIVFSQLIYLIDVFPRLVIPFEIFFTFLKGLEIFKIDERCGTGLFEYLIYVFCVVVVLT